MTCTLESNAKKPCTRYTFPVQGLGVGVRFSLFLFFGIGVQIKGNGKGNGKVLSSGWRIKRFQPKRIKGVKWLHNLLTHYTLFYPNFYNQFYPFALLLSITFFFPFAPTFYHLTNFFYPHLLSNLLLQFLHLHLYQLLQSFLVILQ